MSFKKFLLRRGDSLVLHCATLRRTISCVIGTRISSHTSIKWRIFTDAKLNPSRNGNYLLNGYGKPQFIFIFLLRTVSQWSTKKIIKNLWPFFWQFHAEIGRKELLRVEQLTLKLNLFWSVKYSHSHSHTFFQVRT